MDFVHHRKGSFQPPIEGVGAVAQLHLRQQIIIVHAGVPDNVEAGEARQEDDAEEPHRPAAERVAPGAAIDRLLLHVERRVGHRDRHA